MDKLTHQAKILSITEFTQKIKTLLESSIPETWVRGEVSNLRKQASSGHIYFTLKDAQAQLSAVLFKGDALRQTTLPKEGQQFLAFGDISLYPPRGSYQLIVKVLLPDGIGALQQKFEFLKEKLSLEGLFDANKKIKIPKLPEHIAVITSPSGAAIRDFVSVLERRNFKGHVTILPALVQGKEAAASIIHQLNIVQTLPDVDLVVLTRGGGSLEDLWPFNEEPLIRALASFPFPVISAVGHEIDFTLTDFVADLRAETPSAAAEIISSHYLDFLNRHKLASGKLSKILHNLIKIERLQLDKLLQRLQSKSPKSIIHIYYLKVDDLLQRLQSAIFPKLNLYKKHLSHLKSRLNTSSLQATLKRGFVVLQNNKGTIVKTRTEYKRTEKPLKIIFQDGTSEM